MRLLGRGRPPRRRVVRVRIRPRRTRRPPGHDTAVLCATRGEAGESRIRTDDLAALREAELRDAARILGVGTVRLLDHVDSGMDGEPAPGTLGGRGSEPVAAEVRAVDRRVAPGRRRHPRRQRRPPRPRRDPRRHAGRGRRRGPRTGRDLPLVPGALVDDAVGRPHARRSAAATPTSTSASSARPTTRSPRSST